MTNLSVLPLPEKIKEEIRAIRRSYIDFDSSLNEVRLRSVGPCTLTLGGENVRLAATVSAGEMSECLRKLCKGSAYAYADSIRQGYITAMDGIRVGVSGNARYSDMKMVGISSVDTLVFRFPIRELVDTTRIYEHFKRGGGGMLVFSPPMGGKTTLLASLADSIGKSKRVVIVDERCEFIAQRYKNRMVDILKGYGKASGIEIALRTHSPEVIMVDELSYEDTLSVMPMLNCGIPLIASVHAGEINELYKKEGIKNMIKEGVFQTFVGIKRQNGAFIYELFGDKQ